MVTGENIDDLIAAADVAADEQERGLVVERLASLGVERLDAPPGITFDPTLHRAVSLVPASSPADENTIDVTVLSVCSVLYLAPSSAASLASST